MREEEFVDSFLADNFSFFIGHIARLRGVFRLGSTKIRRVLVPVNLRVLSVLVVRRLQQEIAVRYVWKLNGSPTVHIAQPRSALSPHPRSRESLPQPPVADRLRQRDPIARR